MFVIELDGQQGFGGELIGDEVAVLLGLDGDAERVLFVLDGYGVLVDAGGEHLVGDLRYGFSVLVVELGVGLFSLDDNVCELFLLEFHEVLLGVLGCHLF